MCLVLRLDERPLRHRRQVVPGGTWRRPAGNATTSTLAVVIGALVEVHFIGWADRWNEKLLVYELDEVWLFVSWSTSA